MSAESLDTKTLRTAYASKPFAEKREAVGALLRACPEDQPVLREIRSFVAGEEVQEWDLDEIYAAVLDVLESEDASTAASALSRLEEARRHIEAAR